MWPFDRYVRKVFWLLQRYASRMRRYMQHLIYEIARIFSSIKEIIELLKDIRAILLRIDHKAFPPGPLGITITGEEILGDAMDLMIFDVHLPSLDVPNDVVRRVLTETVGDGATTTVELGPTDTVVTGRKAPEDSVVVLSLQNFDNAGNPSPVREFTFTAKDTIAPPAPGEFGVVVVDEEFDPSPAP